MNARARFVTLAMLGALLSWGNLRKQVLDGCEGQVSDPLNLGRVNVGQHISPVSGESRSRPL